jgi:hypothetical protein
MGSFEGSVQGGVPNAAGRVHGRGEAALHRDRRPGALIAFSITPAK